MVVGLSGLNDPSIKEEALQTYALQVRGRVCVWGGGGGLANREGADAAGPGDLSAFRGAPSFPARMRAPEPTPPA